MADEEKRNNETRFENEGWNTTSFGWPNMPESMAKCFKSMRGPGGSRPIMPGCMRMCRWFPLIAIAFGIIFLLLGYYLDSEMIRVLWILFAGAVVIMGAFGLVFMGAMKKMMLNGMQ